MIRKLSTSITWTTTKSPSTAPTLPSVASEQPEERPEKTDSSRSDFLLRICKTGQIIYSDFVILIQLLTNNFQICNMFFDRLNIFSINFSRTVILLPSFFGLMVRNRTYNLDKTRLRQLDCNFFPVSKSFLSRRCLPIVFQRHFLIKRTKFSCKMSFF